MRRIWIVAIALVLLIGASPGRIDAGGWATVRLDESLTRLVAGQPQTVRLSVWAHDQTRTDVESVTLVATNTDTGESLTFSAESTGQTGEYVTEVTLPIEGTWKVVAHIPPYPDYALPTTEVTTSEATADLDGGMNISVGVGNCNGNPEVSRGFDLLPMPSNPDLFKGELSELETGSLLLLMSPSGEIRACGVLSGTESLHLEIVTLEPLNGSESGAIVSLAGAGSRRAAQALPLKLTEGAEIATIEITERASHDWSFSPAALVVAPGDVVVWINDSGTAHTIASDSPDFLDSSLIEPFGLFAQDFQAEGSFSYLCGPHQWMTGTINVTS